MAVVTIDKIKEILRECAGEEDGATLDGDISGRTFEELGYDSLARLEAAAKIKREYGVDLVDEINDLGTPDDLVGLLTSRLAA
jgi:acyl carrier protein